MKDVFITPPFLEFSLGGCCKEISNNNFMVTVAMRSAMLLLQLQPIRESERHWALKTGIYNKAMEKSFGKCQACQFNDIACAH